MAAGDRINIADKTTLDLVKTSIESVSTKLGTSSDSAGSSSVFAYLRSLLGKADTSISDTSKLVINTIPVEITSASNNVLSVNSPGKLYALLVTCHPSSSTTQGRVRLDINGTTIMVKSLISSANNTQYDSAGLFVGNYLQPVGSMSINSALYPDYKIMTVHNTFAYTSVASMSDTGNSVTILPAPIKFNSMNVHILTTDRATNVSYIYLLD